MSEPLKWEFPGGKVEPGEDPREALRREILEELHLEIEVGALLGRGESVVDGRRIVLDVYAATILAGEVRLVEHQDWGWFTAAEVDRLDWAEADRPVLAELKRLFCFLPPAKPVGILWEERKPSHEPSTPESRRTSDASDS